MAFKFPARAILAFYDVLWPPLLFGILASFQTIQCQLVPRVEVSFKKMMIDFLMK